MQTAYRCLWHNLTLSAPEARLARYRDGLGLFSRQQGNRNGAERSEPSQELKARRVTPRAVVELADDPREQRLCHAVGRENDAHDASEHGRAVELRGHEGNDEVLAAEAEAEAEHVEVDAAAFGAAHED